MKERDVRGRGRKNRRRLIENAIQSKRLFALFSRFSVRNEAREAAREREEHLEEEMFAAAAAAGAAAAPEADDANERAVTAIDFAMPADVVVKAPPLATPQDPEAVADADARAEAAASCVAARRNI